MADNEKVTPKEANEQFQQLFQDLHCIYQAGDEDAQSLARIRQRLLHHSNSTAYHASQQAFYESTEMKIRQERPQHMRTQLRSSEGRSAWQRRFNTIAAVIVASLLVGSLLLLLTHARQNGMGSGNPTPTPKSAQVVIVPTTTIPTLTVPKPNWKILARFSGIGGMIKNSRHIVLPKTWSVLFVCQGSGGMTVLFNSGTILGNSIPTCDSVIHGDDITDTLSPPVQKVQVVVNEHTGWQLLIAGCSLNTLAACGNGITTPTPMPTPTSSVLSTSSPTPMPGTPYPTPVPTVLPTPSPTPMP